MLVDAAKGGDVEIPVFCYEPKLGGPVGACRMCLVEIEGIPKLQTACSTPVRDGMVVYTRTDRVVEAQNAVVEFLLVNHPLDCPVCDKGGECPLQDIALGWGPGRSRVTDPKRHFRKPVAALAARAHRPRALHPLLPLRALQPGGLRGRAAAAARARGQQPRRHLRRPPLHRPLPRQHHRALPRRRADLRGLPLPRPALGHRGLGLDLHALPEPVQRQVHGPRRADPAGARPRQRRGRQRLALRQGPLRLPDDQLRGADHQAAARAATRRLGRDGHGGGQASFGATGAKTAAIVGGQASNEEAYLVQRIVRGPRLAARHLHRRDRCRPAARPLGARALRRDDRRSTPPTRSSSSASTRCTRCRSSTCACARRSASRRPRLHRLRAAHRARRRRRGDGALPPGERRGVPHGARRRGHSGDRRAAERPTPGTATPRASPRSCARARP